LIIGEPLAAAVLPGEPSRAELELDALNKYGQVSAASAPFVGEPALACLNARTGEQRCVPSRCPLRSQRPSLARRSPNHPAAQLPARGCRALDRRYRGMEYSRLSSEPPE